MSPEGQPSARRRKSPDKAAGGFGEARRYIIHGEDVVDLRERGVAALESILNQLDLPSLSTLATVSPNELSGHPALGSLRKDSRKNARNFFRRNHEYFPSPDEVPKDTRNSYASRVEVIFQESRGMMKELAGEKFMINSFRELVGLEREMLAVQAGQGDELIFNARKNLVAAGIKIAEQVKKEDSIPKKLAKNRLVLGGTSTVIFAGGLVAGYLIRGEGSPGQEVNDIQPGTVAEALDLRLQRLR